ncbi:iron chelate uptake ABC transporter family permease subunit [Gephyromycinifex aptenodytis]|uniref:iron chelate uptake ABC transporter family permease subunit n=1 Tax=Gephyromycinifex aptenodytis TaxID=2716227 RepID=UPI0014484474|nr:iron chelate uptake ABC transporter family permease subunit [Gephyromycinifex aptenodytis]
MFELLTYDFMQRALLAALLVGLSAPMVGIFLVQRRLSLIGDGMGHVAFAGVAVGAITGQEPVLTALIAAVGSAVAIELIRAKGRTGGDTALAIMFYGGIAIGVVLMSRAPGAANSLPAYLFGAITTTTTSDVWVFAVLAIAVVATTLILRPRLFAVANDPEYAQAAGLPVLALNLVLAILTAVTVVVAMRVVGLLLISALMIVPNAASQLIARSFAAALWLAVVIGVLCSVGGVVASFYLDTPSGGTIVVLAVIVFAALAVFDSLRRLVQGRSHVYAELHDHEHGDNCGHPALQHQDHIDYLHDGHLHAPHGDHYDEHHSHRHPASHPIQQLPQEPERAP